MMKLLRCYLPALVLCLCLANVPAQEPAMVPPPLLDLGMEPPPEQETAPSDSSIVAPPALEPAPPTTTAESPPSPADATNAPIPVPPPLLEAVFQAPPPGEGATFVPGVPNLQNLALAVPEVEVWREQSTSPQKPGLRQRRFELAYLVGTEPALVLLRFHPLVAGQGVVVQPGPGVTVDPPDTEFRVENNGECVIVIALDGSFSRSDLNVYCSGVKTKVPLARTSQDVVEAQEAAGRGR